MRFTHQFQSKLKQLSFAILLLQLCCCTSNQAKSILIEDLKSFKLSHSDSNLQLVTSQSGTKYHTSVIKSCSRKNQADSINRKGLTRQLLAGFQKVKIGEPFLVNDQHSGRQASKVEVNLVEKNKDISLKSYHTFQGKCLYDLVFWNQDGKKIDEDLDALAMYIFSKVIKNK